jgi:HlyD family secretion protein
MGTKRSKEGSASKRGKTAGWLLVVLLGGGGIYASFHFTNPPPVEVATARVRRGEFVMSVRGRGEVKSARSALIITPRTPDARIVKLATAGQPIKKGEVVVEFDPVTQEQQFIERNSDVRRADSEIAQTQAVHRIANDQDELLVLQTEYNLERAKLEASKQEILSEIQGAKNKIDVTVAEGEVGRVGATVKNRHNAQKAELVNLDERKDKALRDIKRAQGYLEGMVLRAPVDGIAVILPNFRAGGSFGQAPPPFKEGDRSWPGAAIIEIPDMSELQVEFRIEEIDRGLLKMGQPVVMHIDAVPDLELEGNLSWISPIAQLIFTTFPPQKTFPAKATIKKLDPRLRPGMSATAEVIIERQPNALMIPLKASLELDGKPGVFVQRGNRYERHTIQAGKRNLNDLVVLGGLTEGQSVALENPEEAARKQSKR